ncbi:MAG: ATP-binding cassette domain-containing protein [Pseudomonadota bacterium]
MCSFWGLLTAYWTSERWVEAWSLTVGVFVLTTILSKSSVWAAMASADFINSIVKFHAPDAGIDPVALLLTSAAAFAAIHLSRIIGVGIRHMCSSTLHRKARRWVQEQFSHAMLAQNHIAMSLMSDREAGATRLPDNIDQRVDECSENVFAGLIGLAMGIWGSIASIYFISAAILERSTAVPFLDRWAEGFSAAMGRHFGPEIGAAANFAPGDYGSAFLILVLILVYVPLGTYLAWRLGKILEKQTLARQATGGTWRSELNSMLGRSSQLASSQGQDVQARVNDRLYGAIDRVWHKLNRTTVNFMVFRNSYTFLSNRLVAYLPALPGYMSGAMSFRDYSATSELVGELINDTSWFIEVMPAIATLRANARRLTEVAGAIELAQDQTEFYGRTGLSEFRYTTQEGAFGLTIENVALCHRGHDSEPFLRAENLNFQPGHWTYVRGQNGCGKSSLMKAIAGLWPYGEGLFAYPAGETVFFAGQDPDLPERLTLKELVCYPHFGDAYSDLAVAAALSEVGLGDFIRELDADLYQGRPWQGVLSGGQRQRLVLARIIVQRPGVLLLDEACSALDPAAVTAFHQSIRTHCAESVVISIMHEPEPPTTPEGNPFYRDQLSIKNGIATLHRLDSWVAMQHRIAAE